ncbi:MAG TPA: DEAD/DEAH box helicase, partial [Porphyromonadaceae bacterium]|nr:DEAD/DEAH box helicase [Porphyromonadaceae bacterium]
MSEFKKLGVSPEIEQALIELGYEQPMPVQAEVIPQLLNQTRNIIALAQTGTGKTAAFGIPIIQKTNIQNLTPQTLILSPTRELCLQIAGD